MGCALGASLRIDPSSLTDVIRLLGYFGQPRPKGWLGIDRPLLSSQPENNVNFQVQHQEVLSPHTFALG